MSWSSNAAPQNKIKNNVEVTKQYLSPKEAAKYLGLGFSTLGKWRLYGGGPRFAKAGNRVIYMRSELDAWISRRVVENTSQNVDLN